MARIWVARLRALIVLAAISLLAVAAVVPRQASPAERPADCVGSLSIVAHQDDDLLFQTPDLLADVRSARCLTVVFLTAGDAGMGWSYWGAREAGARAAHAVLQGVDLPEWSTTSVSYAGRKVTRSRLAGTTTTLLFLRLPDGGADGAGAAAGHKQSLEALWRGRLGLVRSVDGWTSYTSRELIATLRAIIAEAAPRIVRLQDDTGHAAHSDHRYGARFALAALALLGTEAERVVRYRDYPISALPPNVSGKDLEEKTAAFLAYAAHDPVVCGTAEACDSDEYEGSWLRRQYVVSGPVSIGSPAVPTTYRSAVPPNQASADAPAARIGSGLSRPRGLRSWQPQRPASSGRWLSEPSHTAPWEERVDQSPAGAPSLGSSPCRG